MKNKIYIYLLVFILQSFCPEMLYGLGINSSIQKRDYQKKGSMSHTSTGILPLFKKRLIQNRNSSNETWRLLKRIVSSVEYGETGRFLLDLGKIARRKVEAISSILSKEEINRLIILIGKKIDRDSTLNRKSLLYEKLSLFHFKLKKNVEVTDYELFRDKLSEEDTLSATMLWQLLCKGTSKELLVSALVNDEDNRSNNLEFLRQLNDSEVEGLIRKYLVDSNEQFRNSLVKVAQDNSRGLDLNQKTMSISINKDGGVSFKEQVGVDLPDEVQSYVNNLKENVDELFSIEVYSILESKGWVDSDIIKELSFNIVDNMDTFERLSNNKLYLNNILLGSNLKLSDREAKILFLVICFKRNYC